MVTLSTGKQMNAVVGSPGGVRLQEIDRPEVSEDGVLVRVHASSANPVDLFPTSAIGYLMGGRKPVVLGTDYAGTVVAVGQNVTDFKPGDEVFGGGGGAFAEYKVAPTSAALVHKPGGVSFEHAGVVAVAALTALQAVRDHGGMEPGQHVLINGASGGVGTFAVQIARALGGKVTAVCSPRNVETVRSIGADTVIDYTRDDFTEGSTRYDLLIDIAASHSWPEYARVLAPSGAYVLVGAAAIQHGKGGTVKALGRFARARLRSMLERRRIATFLAKLNKPDLELIGGLIASGQVTPVIERTYALAGAAEALRYLNRGHAQGKLAIDLTA